MRYMTIVLIHVFAALIPIVPGSETKRSVEGPFVWPIEFEGIELTPAALSDRERDYYRDFPGKVARFIAGNREVVVRYLDRPSRKLHPAADCFRGSGYRVNPLPLRRDPEGQYWGCSLAERDDRKFRVCERIEDATGSGWYDVSSWYWAALLGRTRGPWRAVTVADKT